MVEHFGCPLLCCLRLRGRHGVPRVRVCSGSALPLPLDLAAIAARRALPNNNATADCVLQAFYC